MTTTWPIVQDVLELIAYQTDAVVSRELLSGQSGTVTLFAFDEGQGLSEHTAPFDALVYVLDGAADITISGVGYAVSAGEMLIMPAGEPHALQAHTAFKMLLVMLRAGS